MNFSKIAPFRDKRPTDGEGVESPIHPPISAVFAGQLEPGRKI
jgi:hypothetical protein